MKSLTRLFSFFLLFGFPLASYAAIAETRVEDLIETTLSVRTSPVDMNGIPRGAQRVPLLPLKFSASCGGNVQIEEIRVHRIGPGDARDIRRIYLLEGFQRLSRGTRFSRADHRATIRLRNFVVPACLTRRVAIVADFAATAAVGGIHLLTIEALEDIVNDADVFKTDFPIRTIPRGADITPEPHGTVKVTFLPLSGTIGVIRKTTFVRFLVEADNKAHQLLYAITFTNKGSAKGSDIQNFYITRQRGGRALTEIVRRMDGDQVHLRFTRPFFLRRGRKVLFRLMGNAFTANKTVNFILEEPADFVARSSRRSGRRLGNINGTQ